MPTKPATTPEATEAPTPAPLSVVQAMSAVMRDVGAVGKDRRNEQQRFNFRGIDDVVNAVSPALVRHGVVVTPTVVDLERVTTQSAQGKPLLNVYVTVRYTFHGPQGDTLDVVVPAESFDSGDKATAKAMSVAYRTALLQALCLPTDQPDPDLDTYERGHRDARPAEAAPVHPAVAAVHARWNALDRAAQQAVRALWTPDLPNGPMMTTPETAGAVMAVLDRAEGGDPEPVEDTPPA